jgi:thioredoxin 1
MGFIKRLLGLETKPGEPETIDSERFERDVLRGELPCVVEFYNLWCSSCQVMTGLLNEIGPDYLDRARFYKVNAERSPSIPPRYGVSGVPTLIIFRGGEPVDRLSGLVPIDELKEWIERHL